MSGGVLFLSCLLTLYREAVEFERVMTVMMTVLTSLVSSALHVMKVLGIRSGVAE